jgi:hypothetical protein
VTQPSPSPWPPQHGAPYGTPYGTTPPAAPTPGGPPPGPRPPAKYSRFSALVLSFFSADLYRDVARGWRGIGFLYLLLLFVLTWIPPIARSHVSIRRFAYGPEAATALKQFPTVTIQNGVASIAEPEPYVWRDPSNGEPIVYVDTSGDPDSPEAAKAKILLRRSSLEFRNSPSETRVYDLKDVKYFFVDKNKALGYIQRFAHLYAATAYPTVVVTSLVWGLVRLLLYGVIGLIFVSSFNARLDYAALMRLSAVAMTPGMVLDTLGWTFNFGWLPCCGWSALIGVITLVYLGFAVKANAEPAPPGGATPYPYPYPYPSPQAQAYPPPHNPYPPQ